MPGPKIAQRVALTLGENSFHMYRWADCLFAITAEKTVFTGKIIKLNYDHK